jgi:serine/threonine-protein kinase RsbW
MDLGGRRRLVDHGAVGDAPRADRGALSPGSGELAAVLIPFYEVMPGTLDQMFESNLDSVDSAENLCVEAAKQIGLDEDACMDLGLAVREAMVIKQVHFVLETRSDSVRLTITDQGSGFDLNRVPDPTEGANLMRGSGRGLLLIQTFVDEFTVKKAAAGGAEVTLVKYAISD